MKKVLLCFGSIALASCASNAPHQASYDYAQIGAPAVVSPAAPQVIMLKSGDREPAGTPTVQWVPSTFTYKITSDSMQNSYNLTVNQQVSWTETENYNDTCSRYQDVQVQTTCSDIKCSGGSGKSEAWNRFYSAPGDQKAQALADAIKGIGKPTAEALVSAGYFHSKARSWDDFMSEIKRAADAGVINKSVPNEISKNGIENAANLGYSPNSCQVVTSACTAWQPQLVSNPCVKQRDVTRTKVADSRNVHVSIRAAGAKLLPFESDTLSFSVNEIGKLVDADVNGENNHYSVSQSSTGPGNLQIDVTQTSRIPRDLPASAIQRDQFTMVGSQPTMILEIDPAYLPTSQDPNSQLVMDYVVRVCAYGWTGTCGFSSWKDLKLASIQIKDQKTVIPIDLIKQNKGELKYSLKRISSLYYSARPTDQRETSSVKMSK